MPRPLTEMPLSQLKYGINNCVGEDKVTQTMIVNRDRGVFYRYFTVCEILYRLYTCCRV